MLGSRPLSSRIRWQTVGTCCLCVFAAFFLAFLWLQFHYVDTLSSVPDVKTGAIYPWQVRYSIVYLTSKQQLLLHSIGLLGIGFAAVAATIKLLIIRNGSGAPLFR
jgi:hypothetical protein